MKANRTVMVFASLMLAGTASSQAPDSIFQRRQTARYLGELVLIPLSDGRHMRLEKPFGFIDTTGVKWIVPAGAVVDGASIPKVFWSMIGGPFEGRYRNASVIHDYYCDVRTRTWRDTDRAFYDAMLVSGVEEREAKVMYMAVVYGGPQWDSQTIENSLLSATNAVRAAFSELHISTDRGIGSGIRDADLIRDTEAQIPFSPEKAKLLAARVRVNNPSLDQIDALVSEGK